MKHAPSAANQRKTLPMLIGAATVLTAALLTRLAVGSPLRAIHRLNAAGWLPPLWLMSLLWFGSFALVGAAAGSLLACPGGGARREAWLWRGSTFLVPAVVFSLVWYVLLFGRLWPILSCLFPLLSAAAALVCVLSWRLIGGGAWWAVLVFALWQTVLFCWQLAVLLHV